MFCIPALMYLVFSIIYILMDIKKNLYDNMIIKIWITILVFALLTYLCNNGYTIVAWLIVSIPFMFMILVTSILLYIFNVDPGTGTTTVTTNNGTETTSQTTSQTTTQSDPVNTPSITNNPTTFGIGM